jgi:hypothetical protein
MDMKDGRDRVRKLASPVASAWQGSMAEGRGGGSDSPARFALS